MSILTSKVDEGSEAYRTYAARNRRLAEELRDRVAHAALGGPEKHRDPLTQLFRQPPVVRGIGAVGVRPLVDLARQDAHAGCAAPAGRLRIR